MKKRLFLVMVFFVAGIMMVYAQVERQVTLLSYTINTQGQTLDVTSDYDNKIGWIQFSNGEVIELSKKKSTSIFDNYQLFHSSGNNYSATFRLSINDRDEGSYNGTATKTVNLLYTEWRIVTNANGRSVLITIRHTNS